MKILAIDTSCDDTSVAILDGLNVIANVFWSKVKVHRDWGGVVPNEAKRQHEEFLPLVIEEAIKQVNISLNLDEKNLFTLNNIDYFAVTYGPGLAIALEAGIKKAKDLAIKYHKPLVAVNHMAGHIYSVLARDAAGKPMSKIEEFEFPILALTVSGGHTEIVLIKNHFDFDIVGQTVDDAAGECIDKVGRILGFGFPAGKEIDEAASKGNSKAYKFPRPMAYDDTFNFSFSGLKTAVLYEVKKLTGEYSSNQSKRKIKFIDDSKKLSAEQINDIAASLMDAVIDCLVLKSKKAILKHKPKMFVVGGGVIASQALRTALIDLSKELNIKFYYPIPFWLCTDNAAMIGVAANFMIKNNINIFKTNEEIIKIDRVPGLVL